jgi:hypothetical protein
MKVAAIVFKDEVHTYVVCPYCLKVHRHGNVDEGQGLTSHCFQGDYTVGPMFDFAGVMTAVNRRSKDMERKRVLREANKKAREIQQWAAKESAKL